MKKITFSFRSLYVGNKEKTTVDKRCGFLYSVDIIDFNLYRVGFLPERQSITEKFSLILKFMKKLQILSRQKFLV